MIRYRLLPDGGFVAGDTDSSRTAYAYPTSPNAAAAKRQPARVAERMLRQAIAAVPAGTTFATFSVHSQDALNWALLAEVPA